MCCIFTCCGWMIDLVQRLWTFTMSCCISSAVCCVMLTSSMSGIALGYNYSLAEYIDLKETNVSIYLKRGVFDDEIADDMDWRRAGRMPVKGHIGEDNLMTGSPAEEVANPLRSGRRLDDSVFEADDQNKFEGSLMRLTAKPVFQDTTEPHVTDDMEMEKIASKYPSGSLDQMKAIQSLIDSRRAMANKGTTLSPLATYGINERNLALLPLYQNPNEPGNPNRRVMPPGPDMKPPNINPARMAVPGENIGSGINWVVPKRPDLFNQKVSMPDYYVMSATYPSPITLKPDIVRPLKPSTNLPEEAILFATRTVVTLRTSTTKPPMIAKLEKDAEAFNDQFLLEGDVPGKNEYIKLPKLGKSSEEEYEDEIKGLPVRKRRSVKLNALRDKKKKSNDQNVTPYPLDSKSSKISHVFSSVKNISLNNNKSNIQTSTEENMNQGHGLIAHLNEKIENYKSDIDHSVETIGKQSTKNLNKKQQEKTLLDRIMTSTLRKKSLMTTLTTQKVNLVSAKDIKIRTRRKSFESVIVSSKYITDYRTTRKFDSKQTFMSNAELLSSISVNLNEAGLLINPKSSTFVKLLQSTLT